MVHRIQKLKRSYMGIFVNQNFISASDALTIILTISWQKSTQILSLRLPIYTTYILCLQNKHVSYFSFAKDGDISGDHEIYTNFFYYYYLFVQYCKFLYRCSSVILVGNPIYVICILMKMSQFEITNESKCPTSPEITQI